MDHPSIQVLTSLFSQAGRLSANGREEVYDCPMCGGLGKLHFNRAGGKWYCFKEGRGGVLPQMGYSPGSPEITRGRQEVAYYAPDFRRLDDQYHPTQRPFYQYLFSRHCTLEVIRWFRMSYARAGLYKGYVILQVPVGDYFVGRKVLDGPGPKYLNAPLSKRGVICPTFTRPVDEAVIVEGVFDAISVGRVGPAIAILGKTLDHDQRVAIQGLVKSRIILLLDRDAWKEVMLVGGALALFLNVVHSAPPQGKDPGTMELEELKALPWSHCDEHVNWQS